MYGEGISKEGSLIDIGVEMDIVQKSGAWFSYNGERLGQGRENSKQFLKDHPEISDVIEKQIREASNLSAAASQANFTPDEDDEAELEDLV
ncbi:recombinase A [compost metagenome]